MKQCQESVYQSVSFYYMVDLFNIETLPSYFLLTIRFVLFLCKVTYYWYLKNTQKDKMLVYVKHRIYERECIEYISICISIWKNTTTFIVWSTLGLGNMVIQVICL